MSRSAWIAYATPTLAPWWDRGGARAVVEQRELAEGVPGVAVRVHVFARRGLARLLLEDL